VRGVDEAAQIVGTSVVMERRVEIDTVVAPAEPPFELRERHQLDERDAEPRQLTELSRRRRERAFRRERSDVQLVHHLTADGRALPARVVPCERGRIDDLGRTVRTVRLKSRRRIRKESFAAAEAELIARARLGVDQPTEVAAMFGVELDVSWAVYRL